MEPAAARMIERGGRLALALQQLVAGLQRDARRQQGAGAAARIGFGTASSPPPSAAPASARTSSHGAPDSASRMQRSAVSAGCSRARARHGDLGLGRHRRTPVRDEQRQRARLRVRLGDRARRNRSGRGAGGHLLEARDRLVVAAGHREGTAKPDQGPRPLVRAGRDRHGGLEMADRARQPGRGLGRAQLAQHRPARRGRGRLLQGAPQVAGRRLRRSRRPRAAGDGAEQLDDPLLAAARAGQQVRGDALGRDVLRVQDLRGPAVQGRALGGGDVGVDGGGEQRVCEAQRTGLDRAQDVRRRQRVDGRGDALRRPAGQRDDAAQVGVGAEHGDGARHAGGVVGQAHEPHRDRAQHRLRRQRADPRGVLGRRPPALAAYRRDELLEQEDVALGHPPAGVAERLVGAVEGRRDHAARALARQRQRPHRAAADVRRDLGQQVVRGVGLAEAARDDDRDGHLVEALQEVEDQSQRRAIGPVDVVDRDEHRPGLGEVGQHPEEPVHDRVGAAVGLVAGPARRALEQRPGERRRTLQQAVAGLVVGAGEQRLEELQRDAELKVALELGRAGAQDGHAVGASARHRRVEQGRLADAGVALDEQQLTGGGAGGRQGVLDRAQGVLSLEKLSRTGASSDDWSVLRQKTGEPP